MQLKYILDCTLFNAEVLFSHDDQKRNTMIVYVLSKFIPKDLIPNFLNYTHEQVDQYLNDSRSYIHSDEEFSLWSGVLVKNINTELTIKSTYL